VRRVIDATAGLGGDAWRLAMAGLPVLACERDPVVFALLASGWRAARRAGALTQAVVARVELRCSEAGGVVDALDEDDVAVYVDPMYPPPRRASAKPRRELQVLRALLGHGAGAGLVEAAELVEQARAKAARVVVKRPHHAAPLVAGPSFEIESKLVRFDVYVNPARMAPAVAGASA
jgi:16S rRNA (guanine1516-N2)-methyltransferase